MPPCPAPQSGGERFPIGRDRFIRQPVFHVRREILRRGVPILRFQGHRFRTDGIQAGRNMGLYLPWWSETALPNPDENLKNIATTKRWYAGQQHIETRSQAVNIAGGP